MKAYRGGDVEPLAPLILNLGNKMEVNGKPGAPVVLLPRKKPGTY